MRRPAADVLAALAGRYGTDAIAELPGGDIVSHATCPSCDGPTLLRVTDAEPDLTTFWCANGCAEHAIEAKVDELLRRRAGARSSALDGASFILDAPTGVPAVWGRGDDVAWSKDEPFIIVGPQGVGKSTLAGRLTLARGGIIKPELLGFPVVVGEQRVLYIAADRAAQVRRSFARMVGEDDRAKLAERLVVWPGPLPFDLAAKPEQLARFAAEHDADTVVIDSLKDVALDLSKDEVGARLNFALQTAVAEQIQPIGLHHQRKATASNPKPKKLADVYGSIWITAGAGSVLLLWGEPASSAAALAQPA